MRENIQSELEGEMEKLRSEIKMLKSLLKIEESKNLEWSEVCQYDNRHHPIIYNFPCTATIFTIYFVVSSFRLIATSKHTLNRWNRS
ncbi:hypothetical protein EON65_40050 [archaeon]|nr:MAG: hypothetical protein EON65_40050 [archaeon]